MNAPTTTLPFLALPAGPIRKKRVLLVDASRAKRDLRSETMRKLGIEVDCAADISEARCWWRPDLYDLVLINVESTVPRGKFCDDIRSATPPQQIMFLVGKPEYLAAAPSNNQMLMQEGDEPARASDVKIALALSLSEGVPQEWGILEACRRISAVRSVSDARARAIRDRPQPRRDSETSPRKRVEGELKESA